MICKTSCLIASMLYLCYIKFFYNNEKLKTFNKVLDDEQKENIQK